MCKVVVPLHNKLSKNYFYDNDRSFTRKVKELFVAHRVEKQYNKNEILSFYLNNIYFGIINIRLRAQQTITLEQP